MRLDFIEKFTDNPVFFGDIFGISLIAYEAYGKMREAKLLRIINPENDKLIQHYYPYNGFSYQNSLKGNPHYLVKSI